jgi:hypothetical protein
LTIPFSKELVTMAKSLAATVTATATATAVTPIDLPDVFETTALDVIATKTRTPYVVFAQPKATDQWTSFATKLPGLQDGDQVLVYPEPGPVVKLQPMRFTMVACKQYWAQKDGAGNRLAVSATQKPKHEKWSEEVHAACIIYVQKDGSTEAVPAGCTFKTVKCPAALSVKLQIEAAEKPEWAQQSEAHKMAFAALSKPFLRVVGSVSINKRTSGAGFSYTGARAIVSPATPAEWMALKNLIEAEDGKTKLAELASAYKQRLAELGV